MYLKWQSPLGRGAFIQSLTPEEPLLQRMTNVVYCSKWVPAFIGTLMLSAEVIQVCSHVMSHIGAWYPTQDTVNGTVYI